ncbi:MAG: hypothetical protein HC850_16250, partial [Rhodomicrobium sp.]|nr:hypothetical protein [Rhodomicrobium sp.]
MNAPAIAQAPQSTPAIAELMERARAAQTGFATASQERTDAAVRALA